MKYAAVSKEESATFTESIYAATRPLIKKLVKGGMSKVEQITEKVSIAHLSVRDRELCELRCKEAFERQRVAS